MEISYSGLIGRRLRKEMPDGVEQLRVLPRRSWKMIFIALALIILKDAQVVIHIVGHRNRFDIILAIIWTLLFVMLILASLGEFFGFEIFRVCRGELLIIRGVGPLHRTFRYPVNGIRDLVSSDPTDKDGKRHLGNIMLKPKAGAVRFECSEKTWYFGDSLDEGDGESIVRWLKLKLPQTAIDSLPLE